MLQLINGQDLHLICVSFTQIVWTPYTLPIVFLEFNLFYNLLEFSNHMVFLSLKFVNIAANSVEPDEMLHSL